MIRLLAIATLFLGLFSTASIAQAPPPSSVDDTNAYVGLNWTFGSDGQGLEGIIGVVHASTDSNGDTTGARLSFHFDFANGTNGSKIKLTGLFGDPEKQGEAGIGFQFGSNRFFGVVGGNSRHVNAGADIGFDGWWDGYLGFHSIGVFEEPGGFVTVVVGPPSIVSAF